MIALRFLGVCILTALLTGCYKAPLPNEACPGDNVYWYKLQITDVVDANNAVVKGKIPPSVTKDVERQKEFTFRIHNLQDFITMDPTTRQLTTGQVKTNTTYLFSKRCDSLSLKIFRQEQS